MHKKNMHWLQTDDFNQHIDSLYEHLKRFKLIRLINKKLEQLLTLHETLSSVYCMPVQFPAYFISTRPSTLIPLNLNFWSIYLCSSVHQCCKFGENTSDTFLDIMFQCSVQGTCMYSVSQKNPPPQIFSFFSQTVRNF